MPLPKTTGAGLCHNIYDYNSSRGSKLVQFRGYDFYELSQHGIKFKFDEEEALKFGASQDHAFDLMVSKFCGMVRRDLKIEKYLIELGIKHVVDIGGKEEVWQSDYF